MASDQPDGDQAHHAGVERKSLHAVAHLVMLTPRIVSHCRHPESCSAIVYGIVLFRSEPGLAAPAGLRFSYFVAPICSAFVSVGVN